MILTILMILMILGIHTVQTDLLPSRILYESDHMWHVLILEYVASREHTVKAQEACRSGTLGLFCTAFKKLGQGIR